MFIFEAGWPALRFEVYTSCIISVSKQENLLMGCNFRFMNVLKIYFSGCRSMSTVKCAHQNDR